MSNEYRDAQIVKHALQYYINRPNASELDLKREQKVLDKVTNQVKDMQKLWDIKKQGAKMMKIKVNKEFKLLELIEYIKKNEIADKVFFDNKGKGKVVVGDDRYLYMTDLNLTDTFTVEVEKVITERTVIPLLVETYLSSKGEPSCYSYRNKSINYILENNKYYNNMPPKHIYNLNDDMTMTLIWKDGEMVE